MNDEFFDYALERGARQGSELTCEASAYCNANHDWRNLVATIPAFARQLDELDTMICDANHLAGLINTAGNMVVRQALRMVAEMRRLTRNAGITFDLSKASQEILRIADAEWDEQLNLHPAYTKLLLQIDFATCPKRELIEALDLAPSDVIRQAMREAFLFREAYEVAHGRTFR